MKTREVPYDLAGVLTSSVSDLTFETGCTVISFPDGAIGAIDVRGGSPATREEAALGEYSVNTWVDAIVLSGGSTYGLEAASGVMKKIFAKRNHSVSFEHIPCVPAACVYDFRNRSSPVYPDVQMGEHAYDHLRKGSIDIGRVGAGTNVWVGKFLKDHSFERGGQGAHFEMIQGCGVLAVTVVNALGNILDLNGRIVAGSLRSDGGRSSATEASAIDPVGSSQSSLESTRGNTTISCLVTNADLNRAELKRLATMVHSSMARVIEPFHTPFDGDVLFAIKPNGTTVPVKDSIKFLAQCAVVMQKAVLSAIER